MTHKHLSYAEMMARRFAADHAVTRRRLLANGAKLGAASRRGSRAGALGSGRRRGPGGRAAGDRIEPDRGPAHPLPLPGGYRDHDGGELPDPRQPDHVLAAELPGLRRQPGQFQPERSAARPGSHPVLPHQRHPRLERPGHRALPRAGRAGLQREIGLAAGRHLHQGVVRRRARTIPSSAPRPGSGSTPSATWRGRHRAT